MSATKLKRRRVELGLSRRNLARASGVSIALIEALENESRVSKWEEVSVRRLKRIGDAIGVEFVSGNARGGLSNDCATDAKVIGALVYEAGKEGIGVSELEEILGWSQARVVAALDALRPSLEATGTLLVASPSNGVRLCAATELPRPAVCRPSAMSDAEYAMLFRLVQAGASTDLIALEAMTPAERDTVAQLISLGIVEHSRNAIRLSTATAVSLAIPQRDDEVFSSRSVRTRVALD